MGGDTEEGELPAIAVSAPQRPARAIIAVAASMLTAVYVMLRDEKDYQDLGVATWGLLRRGDQRVRGVRHPDITRLNQHGNAAAFDLSRGGRRLRSRLAEAAGHRATIRAR